MTEQKLTELLRDMSLEEKVNQMSQVTGGFFNGEIVVTGPMADKGFTEVNVIMQGLNDIDTLAEFVQIGVDYIMNHFSVNCSSYNLFFYLIEGNIHVKIMPRFATSPLFIGYNIELVPNNLQEIAKHIKQLYFDKKND